MNTPTESNPITRMIGFIFLAVSGLWIAFCGLCGAWLIGQVFLNNRLGPEILSGIVTVVLICGTGIGLGYVFWALGRTMTK